MTDAIQDALRVAIQEAYRHGYARGHVDAGDGRFDADTATDAYLDEMAAYARDLLAVGSAPAVDP